MASLALMARLTSAELSWLRSTNAGHTSPRSAVRISISCPIDDGQQSDGFANELIDVDLGGPQRLLTGKASRLAVSCAPRSAAFADQLRNGGKMRDLLDAVGQYIRSCR